MRIRQKVTMENEPLKSSEEKQECCSAFKCATDEKVGSYSGLPEHKKSGRLPPPFSLSSYESKEKRYKSSKDSFVEIDKKQQKKEDKRRKEMQKKKKKVERKEKKCLKKKKKEEKKEKKRLRKIEKARQSLQQENDIGPHPDDMSASLVKAPITKEQWEKQQNSYRRELDPESGRYRLIKGTGEVMEECVSHERHKAINNAATEVDGTVFQAYLRNKLNP